MSLRRASVVVAGLVLVVGVAIGFLHHSIDSQGTAVSCGSAFMPDSGKLPADAPSLVVQYRDADLAKCSDKLEAPRIVAFGLIGIGALALLFVALTNKRANVAAGPATR